MMPEKIDNDRKSTSKMTPQVWILDENTLEDTVKKAIDVLQSAPSGIIEKALSKEKIEGNEQEKKISEILEAIEDSNVSYSKVIALVRSLKILPRSVQSSISHYFWDDNKLKTPITNLINFDTTIHYKAEMIQSLSDDYCNKPIKWMKASDFSKFLRKFFDCGLIILNRSEQISPDITKRLLGYKNRLDSGINEDIKIHLKKYLIEKGVLPRIEDYRKRSVISPKFLLKWCLENVWEEYLASNCIDSLLWDLILKFWEQEEITIKEVVIFFKKSKKNRANFNNILKFIMDLDETHIEIEPMSNTFREWMKNLIERFYYERAQPVDSYSGDRGNADRLFFNSYLGPFLYEYIEELTDSNSNILQKSEQKKKIKASSLLPEEVRIDTDVIEVDFIESEETWESNPPVQNHLLVVAESMPEIKNDITEASSEYEYIQEEIKSLRMFLFNQEDNKYEKIQRELINQADYFIHPHKYEGEDYKIPTINEWMEKLARVSELWYKTVNRDYSPLNQRVWKFEQVIKSLEEKLPTLEDESDKYKDCYGYNILKKKISTIEKELKTWKDLVRYVSSETESRLIKAEDTKQEINALIQSIIRILLSRKKWEKNTAVEEAIAMQKESLLRMMAEIQGRMLDGTEENPEEIVSPFDDRYIEKRLRDHEAMRGNYMVSSMIK